MVEPKKRKPPTRWVSVGPLAPWMKSYAQWLVSQPSAELTVMGTGKHRSPYPTIVVRAHKASIFAARSVQERVVGDLERRPDFRAYFEKIRDDASAHAKELGKQAIAANFEAREAALASLVKKEVDQDGKATYTVEQPAVIERFTRPYVELAFPKKEASENHVPRIVINIGAGAAKNLLDKVLAEPDEIQDVEFEIVEKDKLLTDGEE